jgi:hypothetical protein
MLLRMIAEAICDRRGFLFEGIYFGDTTGLTPQNIETARGQAGVGGRRGGVKGANGLVDLFMNRPYLYRDEDSPEDLVHLQAIDKIEQLPFLPTNHDSRLSFRGVKIYYAFAVVPNESYQGKEVEAAYPKVDDTITVDQAKETARLMRSVFADADSFTRKDVRDIIGNLDDYFTNPDFRNSRDSLRKLRIMLPSLVTGMTRLKAATVKQLITFLSRPNTSTRHKFSADVLRYAKQSLAKKIKRPTQPGEEEMSQKVIEKAATNFIRIFRDPFDVIVTPTSSAGFNSKFVEVLKQMGGWGGTPVITLDKLLGKDVDIDLASLYDIAQRHHDAASNGTYNDKLVMTPERLAAAAAFHSRKLPTSTLPPVDMNQSLPPTDPRWVEWWIQGKVAAIESQLKKYEGVEPPVKALQLDQLKQYIQLYGDNEQLGSVKGKRVLIIDDNVAYSATMQMVHALVKEHGPNEVMIFTPFYMGG